MYVRHLDLEILFRSLFSYGTTALISCVVFAFILPDTSRSGYTRLNVSIDMSNPSINCTLFHSCPSFASPCSFIIDFLVIKSSVHGSFPNCSTGWIVRKLYHWPCCLDYHCRRIRRISSSRWTCPSNCLARACQCSPRWWGLPTNSPSSLSSSYRPSPPLPWTNLHRPVFARQDALRAGHDTTCIQNRNHFQHKWLRGCSCEVPPHHQLHNLLNCNESLDILQNARVIRSSQPYGLRSQVVSSRHHVSYNQAIPNLHYTHAISRPIGKLSETPSIVLP